MAKNDLQPHQTTVRTTMWPDRDHVVDVDEIPGLRSQRLLIEDDNAGDPAGDGTPGAPGRRGGRQNPDT